MIMYVSRLVITEDLGSVKGKVILSFVTVLKPVI
jgi:hypothetical protein